MADLKSNHGGKRKGAGKKLGSTNKLRVSDFFNGDERDELINQAKKLVLFTDKPDKDMLKFLWEQLHGKATMKIAGDENLDPLKLIQIIKNDAPNK